MRRNTGTLLACILSVCNSIPIFQPQIGIIASNSNEIFRLNGMTIAGLGLGQAQGPQFLSPYLIQQQPNMFVPPQVMNFNPQLLGPFLPQQGPPILQTAQGNQLPPLLYPPSQQEQPIGPLDPNAPQPPQNPGQVFPQYYPSLYPQRAGQGYPYYLSYGYPQRNTPVVMPPNQNTGQQNLEKATQKPQLPLQNRGKEADSWTAAPPPDHRGDTTGTGIDEGYPGFPFLFQP